MAIERTALGMCGSRPRDCRHPTRGSDPKGTESQKTARIYETIVQIKNICRVEFEQFLRFHTILELAIGREVEWFSDTVENTIGTIAFCQGQRGWNYAVLKRDWTGDFQVRDLGANLFSLEAARVDFRRAMTEAENTEHSLLPRNSE